jgi:hypothetical protein
LSYQWVVNPTITLAAGNNTYNIAALGGNNIVGNGGLDTVIYSGLYSQFQIETLGSETLVTENNNVSTLDYLQGITYIKFSDGTYDTATSSFSPATAAPTVASVTASGSGITNGSGDLNAGHVVTLTLTMSEAVTVAGGTPTLTLNDGGTATYTGESAANALAFSYTVMTGQNTPDLTVSGLKLNGAAITDAAGNNADFTTLPTPIGTLQIDTTPPAPPVISTDTVNGHKSVTLTGTAEANSTITVYDTEGVLGQTHANTGGSWSFSTAPLKKGNYTFMATATDAAGNVSALSNSIDPPVGVTSTDHPPALGPSSIGKGRQVSVDPSNDAFAFHPELGLVAGSQNLGATPTHNEHGEFPGAEAHENIVLSEVSHDVPSVHEAALVQMHHAHLL